MNATTPGSSRRFLTPRFLIGAGLIGVAGAVAMFVWFQPQKLFIDERVNEAPPGTVESNDGVAGEGAMSFSGDFRSLAHETSGSASLAQAPDSRYYVRLEDFSTENGPDLFVYLSTAPAGAQGREFTDEFVDLGRLKGNTGNQNYLVPSGVDLERYRTVVIWCRRFTTGFGVAPLESLE